MSQRRQFFIVLAAWLVADPSLAQPQDEQSYVAQEINVTSDISRTTDKSYLDSLLYMDEQTLDEVVVSVRRPTLSTRLDRKVYQVGQDVTSVAGSLSDLLQNVPSVDVDIDGNVSLRGSDQVTILVNGKPSAMLNGKTREDALAQFAASSIERIEIITVSMMQQPSQSILWESPHTKQHVWRCEVGKYENRR